MKNKQHSRSSKLFIRHLLLASIILASIQIVNVKAVASTEIHEHLAIDIPKNTPIPKIEITAFRDAIDGVNIHVETEKYILNPPDLAVETSDNKVNGILQGHAHIFVNGVKRQRLYANDVHIPQEWLDKQVNQIAISLNSHQHENWMSGDHTIVSSVFIDLSKDPLVLYNFSSQPLENRHAYR
jgi:hypothetical protein